MKSFIKYTSIVTLVVLMASCAGDSQRSREVQYMGDTDMYEAVPYETYSSNPILEDGMSAQHPVAGTIARGKTMYDVPNSEIGYQYAKDSVRSPLWEKAPTDSVAKISDENMSQGKYLYGIYCASCHGNTGDGQGVLVQNEKFLGVPSYKDREITEGSIYHVIMYGRNLMGSHASQLNDKERWQVTHYVEQLRKDLLK
ncbi:cytochrome c [Aureibaculum sp. 2210JD6-5]|uniref:c-type cytochrome n=1 Tax=Aureibaculum sp. 2210JD6-5 TaxID=3103957 RepID=UPI002AAECCCB|nr:cytochrome c [Aureibaculum sp. 2210JD6-5]MDY7394571.1 cytochrome c [Aureibaculum sp. 2210JD6-5]